MMPAAWRYDVTRACLMHDPRQERGRTQNVSCVDVLKESETDGKTAICNDCSASAMRGGAKTKSFDTTNLINHLKNRHPDRYNEFMAARKENLTNSLFSKPWIKPGNTAATT